MYVFLIIGFGALGIGFSEHKIAEWLYFAYLIVDFAIGISCLLAFGVQYDRMNIVDEEIKRIEVRRLTFDLLPPAIIGLAAGVTGLLWAIITP